MSVGEMRRGRLSSRVRIGKGTSDVDMARPLGWFLDQGARPDSVSGPAPPNSPTLAQNDFFTQENFS